MARPTFTRLRAGIAPERRDLTRPGPIGVNARGITLYSGRAVKAYRLMCGVTQEQVAARLFCRQSLVEHYESGRPEFQARQAVAMLDVIQDLARIRARLVAEGEAMKASLSPEEWGEAIS